jgi:Flp pilus assembly pilin Flp
VSGVLSVLRAGVRRLASRFVRDERGQTLIEYMMIGLLVFVFVLVSVMALRGQLNTVIQKITNALSST